MIANEHSGPGQATSFGQLSPVQVSTAGSTVPRPSGVSSSKRACRSSASDTFKPLVRLVHALLHDRQQRLDVRVVLSPARP